MKMLKTVSAYAVELKSKANGPKVARMKFRSAAATEVTSPDELMKVLKRYLRESNESEIVVASRIGVNRHSLNRWLTSSQKPNKRPIGVNRVLPQRFEYL